MKTLPNDGVSADIENLDSLNDEALARLAQNGSSDAEHTLVVRFMPLVRIKARPYFLIGADHSDLVQEGSIGLFSAIRDYDCEKHTSFRTYAEVCIGNNIIAAIKRATRKKHFPLNSYISLDKPVFSIIPMTRRAVSATRSCLLPRSTRRSLPLTARRNFTSCTGSKQSLRNLS